MVMLESKEKRIEEHRKFMEAKATLYLKPLMVDILKNKPDDVLDFIAQWCQGRGKEIRREHGLEGKVKAILEKENPPAPVAPAKQPTVEKIREKTVTEIKDQVPESAGKAPSQIDANKPSLPSQRSQVLPVSQPSAKEVVAEQSVKKLPEAEPVPIQPEEVTKEEAPAPTEASAPAEETAPAQPDQEPKPDLPSSEDDQEDLDDDDERMQKLNDKRNTTKKKMGISAEAYGNYNQMSDFVAPVIEKSEEQREQIRKTLGMSFMFKNLDAKDFESVMGAMAVKNFGDGDFVIRQGDDGGELFIVGEGTLRCEKIFPPNDNPTVLKRYAPGEVFGELSLMYNAPRAASIISEGASVCFSLDRDTFNNIVKGAAIKRRNVFEDFLSKIEILADLEPYERSKICDCLNTETFSQGEFVIREGDEGQKFYLVQEGTAEAVKEINGEPVSVMQYGPNSYFGELALLNNDKRKASIRVTSDKLVVASLDKNSFKRMLGPTEAILKRNSEKYAKYAEQIRE